MSAANSYDRVHYPGLLYHQTRPDHLETLGWLHGLDVTPATRARVLEIGCGTAENLILTAECFPEAQLVGIDLSASQIEAAQALARAVGVTSVDLRVLDLTTVDASLGSFDIIVAHGVYSWVPPPVREALLRVIRARLAPTGMAFFSHNVGPGFFIKAMARGMMEFATRGLDDPRERVGAGRAFLDFVVSRANPTERLYRATIAERAKLGHERRDDVLYHDDLSPVCDGSWFWETAERLAAHGLQFLCDADPEMLGPTGLGPEALHDVEQMAPGLLAREQLLDFLRNRAFRMTVCCRAELEVRRGAGPARVVEMHAGLGPAVEEVDLEGGTISTAAARLTLEDPLTRAAVIAMGRAWPGSMPFAELAAATGAEAGPLVGRLLELYSSGIVSLSRRAATFATAAPARPRACALARVQAAGAEPVANLRHTTSALDELGRRALPLLDGTRDREALARELDLDAAGTDALLARLASLALLHPGSTR